MANLQNELDAYDARRASVIADLMRAQRALLHDPDLAALYLDGALRQLLALVAIQIGGSQAASQALSLRALDHLRPHLARRLRLALRAPHVEARLAHCWALIELLNADAALASQPRES
jgi:hypothetical protein